jgi:hypothetical protein
MYYKIGKWYKRNPLVIEKLEMRVPGIFLLTGRVKCTSFGCTNSHCRGWLKGVGYPNTVDGVEVALECPYTYNKNGIYFPIYVPVKQNEIRSR